MMNSPSAGISIKDVLKITGLILLLLSLQAYRAFNLAPIPESIWDNVYVWDWARSFSMGDFSGFLSDSHHLMRWGIWLPTAVMIELFSDDILVYFLATLIPSTIAISLFTYVAYREIGFFSALVFLLLWFFDALLFRASFQLLPSGQGLLPIAILFMLMLKVVRKQEISTLCLIAVTVVAFWLYGTKETHLAFLPGVLFLVYQVGGLNKVAKIIGLFAVLYLIETFAFSMIAESFGPLGRVFHLMSGGQHVQIMTEHSYYVGQQTRYFDSGITMRWIMTSGVTPLVLFAAYFVIFVNLAIKQNTPITSSSNSVGFNRVIAAFLLSFFLFTTFFIISISPIRLGHGLVPRYVTLAMPFAYLMLIAFVSQLTKHKSLGIKFGFLAIIPFFIAPSIHRYQQYAPRDIMQISNNYNAYAKGLEKYECVRATQRSILMNSLDLVPFRFRNERLQKLITQDDLVSQQGNWFVAVSEQGKECKSMYTIQIKTEARY